MLRYECDNCRRLKPKEEEWILGFAAENIGARAARREITFLSRWDEARAADWLAVHFCSDPCKQEYMTRLFARTPPAGVMTEVAVLPVTKRQLRAVPGGKLVITKASRGTGAPTPHKGNPRGHKHA